jgi:hypothetical protein
MDAGSVRRITGGAREEIADDLPKQHSTFELQRPKKPGKTGWIVAVIECGLGKSGLRERRR